MSITVDQLYQQALSLPLDSRESLVEKLVLSIEANVDPDVERAHVQEAILIVAVMHMSRKGTRSSRPSASQRNTSGTILFCL